MPTNLIAMALPSTEWAAPAIAFLSLIVAILSHRSASYETHLKEEESRGRAAETKKYADTLEKFAQAAQFAQYLEGMHERSGQIAEQLETVAEHRKQVAQKSTDITEVATKQIEKSLVHLRKATVAMGRRRRNFSPGP